MLELSDNRTLSSNKNVLALQLQYNSHSKAMFHAYNNQVEKQQCFMSCPMDLQYCTKVRQHDEAELYRKFETASCHQEYF